MRAEMGGNGVGSAGEGMVASGVQDRPCLSQVSYLGGRGPAVGGQRIVSITAACQLTDLSPCSGEFILGWVEFDGAVKIG